VDSFIDQHWIVETSRNIDGFRLSNYMHKDRLGKLAMDPIWDWNLSWGNANYLNGWRTNGWYSSEVGDADYPWFRRLFQDPDFTQQYIDRWAELRRDVFATANVLARVDELAAYLNEAQIRNYQKWRILGTYVWPNWYIGRTYQDEINWMKRWIVGRLAWIDSNYTPAPVFSRSAGLITPGFTLDLTASKGLIYYTLDGLDPRLPGGSVNPQALLYSSPLTLSANTRVFARARNGTAWSAPAAGTFVISTPPLVVTEIMYHPENPPPDSPYSDEDFEFLELKNVGTASLDLAGIRFTAGIAFTFTGSPVASLAPGQQVVIVKNLAAFTSRYGSLPNIAGEYLGSLDNAGERLALEGALAEPILSFSYEDAWHPASDGFGFSLVIVDEPAPRDAWDEKAGWRASATAGGSPGADDPPPPVPPVWINEVLTHTDPPLLDSIELYNPNSTEVDLSYWYLTDQRSAPKKYRMRPDTKIGAGGYLLLTETDFNSGSPDSFLLDSHGEEIYLYSANAAGELTGYSDGFGFGAAQNGVSFGRHVNSAGQVSYPAQEHNSLGSANAGPRAGPVVMSEIRYHPAPGGEEFIELKNITGTAVKLYDPSYPAHTWKLNGAAFRFPPHTEIPANGWLILAASDPALFRTKYNVPETVQIFALYPGVLQESGEFLRLQRPDTPELDTNTGTLFIPYLDVDVVRYNDKPPWPTNADGGGPSLERLNGRAYGNDPLHWRASYGPGTPGREIWESVGDWKGRYFSPTELADPAVGADESDPDGDGRNNFEEYLSGTDPRDAQRCLKVTSVATGGAPQRVLIRFDGVTDRGYSIQHRDSLVSGTWVTLTNIPPLLASGPSECSVASPTNSARRFYRLVTPWQP
jgi:hypothetical protein